MKTYVLTADFEHKNFGRLKSDKIIKHGYLEMESFDLETAFDLCNWSCWTEEKPECVHTDIEWIGHGLIVVDGSKPMYKNPQFHLALSGGWLSGDYETIKDYLRYHMHEACLWTKEIKWPS